MDALDDLDGDGLINLHECWAGTDPLAADGSNTLYSVCSRSVDDRLRAVDASLAVDWFLDFLPNAATNAFVSNPDFWLRDVNP